MRIVQIFSRDVPRLVIQRMGKFSNPKVESEF